MDKWGASWQPTNVPSGWSPYTNGNFQYCDDCGWTFASDEPWAWATYHYGRWARVHSGCGWAWIPGKVWAGSWVSWRSGGDTIGWAPLPPEAGCELGVGISTWADHEYDIGPDYYNFINIRDFGSDSYLRGGFIFDRGRNVTIINQTINITNIAYNRSVTYAGGPNFLNLNQAIQRQGGRPIATVNMNRLNSRRIQGGVAATHTPRIAETLGSDKIDKGWPKDPKIQNDLRKHVAEQTRGQTPKTTRATVPPDVAQNVSKKHGGSQQTSGSVTKNTGVGHPGEQHPKPNNPPASSGSVTKNTGLGHPGDQHPKANNPPASSGSVTKNTGLGHPGDQHPKPNNPPAPSSDHGPGKPGPGDGRVVNNPPKPNNPPAPSSDHGSGKPGPGDGRVVNNPPKPNNPPAPSSDHGSGKPGPGDGRVVNNPPKPHNPPAPSSDHGSGKPGPGDGRVVNNPPKPHNPPAPSSDHGPGKPGPGDGRVVNNPPKPHNPPAPSSDHGPGKPGLWRRQGSQ